MPRLYENPYNPYYNYVPTINQEMFSQLIDNRIENINKSRQALAQYKMQAASADYGNNQADNDAIQQALQNDVEKIKNKINIFSNSSMVVNDIADSASKFIEVQKAIKQKEEALRQFNPDKQVIKGEWKDGVYTPNVDFSKNVIENYDPNTGRFNLNRQDYNPTNFVSKGDLNRSLSQYVEPITRNIQTQSLEDAKQININGRTFLEVKKSNPTTQEAAAKLQQEFSNPDNVANIMQQNPDLIYSAAQNAGIDLTDAFYKDDKGNKVVNPKLVDYLTENAIAKYNHIEDYEHVDATPRRMVSSSRSTGFPDLGSVMNFFTPTGTKVKTYKDVLGVNSLEELREAAKTSPLAKQYLKQWTKEATDKKSEESKNADRFLNTYLNFKSSKKLLPFLKPEHAKLIDEAIRESTITSGDNTSSDAYAYNVAQKLGIIGSEEEEKKKDYGVYSDRRAARLSQRKAPKELGYTQEELNQIYGMARESGKLVSKYKKLAQLDDSKIEDKLSQSAEEVQKYGVKADFPEVRERVHKFVKGNISEENLAPVFQEDKKDIKGFMETFQKESSNPKNGVENINITDDGDVIFEFKNPVKFSTFGEKRKEVTLQFAGKPSNKSKFYQELAIVGETPAIYFKGKEKDYLSQLDKDGEFKGDREGLNGIWFKNVNGNWVATAKEGTVVVPNTESTLLSDAIDKTHALKRDGKSFRETYLKSMYNKYATDKSRLNYYMSQLSGMNPGIPEEDINEE